MFIFLFTNFVAFVVFYRVLRPPGGGTSDIFGGDMPQTPRSIKNHMQSSIFSADRDSVKNNGKCQWSDFPFFELRIAANTREFNE